MTQENWIVLELKSKCPKCGRETTETGKDAQTTLYASTITCLNCGFTGDYGL
jgi:predicted RNA-binding Zn-ribbon protein involved in translation (DUF1610 family)